uniref:Uncharacterized protein n=1 Tax=Moniliophthora roreri TaxID=221103 RepID=A0A0W0F7J4_MONRR
MFFSKSSLAVVAAIVAAVQANDGFAFLNNTVTRPTRACGSKGGTSKAPSPTTVSTALAQPPPVFGPVVWNA